MNDAASPTRVMLVDDHAMVRFGFRMLLESTSGYAVVAEAEDGEGAIAQLAQTAVDVVVLDLSMPGMGGLESLRRMRARNDALSVLVLSAHEEAAFARRVLQAGGRGYLTKRAAPEALVDAVRTVANGQIYLEPALAQTLALNQLDGNAAAGPLAQLSEREFIVFVRLAEGATVNTIAQELSLASSTVGTHLYNIKRKLSLTTQAEMTLLAIRHHIIDP